MKGQFLHWTTIIILALIIVTIVPTVSFAASQKQKERVETLQLDFADYQTMQQMNQALFTKTEDGTLFADKLATIFYSDVEDEVRNFLQDFFGSEFSNLEFGISEGKKYVRVTLRAPTNYDYETVPFSATVTEETNDAWRTISLETFDVQGEVITVSVRRYVI